MRGATLPFRPERLVITSDVAAKLDEEGLAVTRIIHHGDGTATLVLEPSENAESGLCVSEHEREP